MAEQLLPLHKTTVLQCATVSSRSSLQVLPPGSKKTQRVLVGDDSGLIQCLALKRGSSHEVDFRYQLAEGKCDCIALGSSGLSAPPVGATAEKGTPGLSARERIFTCSGSTVRGVSRKGKDFFTLETALTEPFLHCAVEGASIYAASAYAFCQYDDGQESVYLSLPSPIKCLLADRVASPASSSTGPLDVLLGCADGIVRLVVGGKVTQELSMPGSVGQITALVAWEPAASVVSGTAGAVTVPVPLHTGEAAGGSVPGQGGGTASGRTSPIPQLNINWAGAGKLLKSARELGSSSTSLTTLASQAIPTPRYFLYGTSTGAIGALVGGHGSGGGLRHLWQLGPEPGGGSSAVSSLACFDMRGSGQPDLLVARQEGGIEVHAVLAVGAEEQGRLVHGFGDDAASMPSSGSSSSAPLSLPGGTPTGLHCLCSLSVPESIRCIAAGHVTTPGVPELLVLTFAGRLYSFTTERLDEKVEGEEAGVGRSKGAAARVGAAAGLRKEIEELRKAVEAASQAVREQKEAALQQSRRGSASSNSGRGDGGAGSGGPGGTQALPKMDAAVTWALHSEDGAYTLGIELPKALEAVVLSSTVPLDVPGLVDEEGSGGVGAGWEGEGAGAGGAMPLGGAQGASSILTGMGAGGDEYAFGRGINAAAGPGEGTYGGAYGGGSSGSSSSNAILSRSPVAPLTPSLPAQPSPASAPPGPAQPLMPPAFVLTARLPERGNKVWLKVRTVEGSQGEVTAVAIARGAQPASTGGSSSSAASLLLTGPATVIKVPIRPLSLHVRLLEPVQAVEGKVQGQWADWCARHRERYARRGGKGDKEAQGGDRSSDVLDIEGGSTRGSKAGQAARGGTPSTTTSSTTPTGALLLDESAMAAIASIARGSAEAARAAVRPPPPAPMAEVPPPALPATFPWSTLTITGTFSLAAMHEWVSALLPDVPPRMAASSSSSSSSGGAAGGEQSVQLAYRHVLLGTHLLLSYTANRAVLRSDNLSTLAVARVVLIAHASAVKVRVEGQVQAGLGEGGAGGAAAGGMQGAAGPLALPLRHTLSLLHARLVYILSLSYRAALVDAVREMVQSEVTQQGGGEGGGLQGLQGKDAPAILASYPWLHPQWADILARGEEYKAAAQARPMLLSRLMGLLTDLWMDYQRLVHGREGGLTPLAAATLEQLVQGYDKEGGPQALLAFMDSPP